MYIWVPGHVYISGNDAADRATKEALEKERINDLMPFSDRKPLTAKYVYIKFGRKNGMKLREYPTSFITSYQNFRTNC